MDDKILEKIKKILALVDGGSTDEERDTAMLHAQKMLDKYNLTIAEVCGSNKDKKYQESDPMEVSVKSNLKEKLISSLLMSFYNVQIVYNRRYKSRYIRFFGQKHNVEVAKYMFTFLENEFDMRWGIYVFNNDVKGTGLKNTFFEGMHTGLYRKLKEQRKATIEEYSGSMDVMVLDETAEIMNWIISHIPDLKKGKVIKSQAKDRRVYNDGVEEGKKIQLNNQLGDLKRK